MVFKRHCTPTAFITMQLSQALIYIGPNRRSDHTVIEWALQLAAGEQEAFGLAAANGLQAVRATLSDLGCSVPVAGTPQGHNTIAGNRNAVFAAAQCVAGIALAMQQAGGHRVAFSTVLPGSNADQYRLIYEYEHAGIGEDAGELALRVLSASIPGMEWELAGGLDAVSLEDAYQAFLTRAAEHLLPLDAQAIIDAAARLDVPCVKLEREPYGSLPGDFRIRRNGLLKLGHSCHQHIVDGSLCIDRSPALVPLLFDREKLFACLLGLGLPAARQDRELRNLLSAKRAVRAADRIGYPVVLKPAARVRAGGFTAGKAFPPLRSAQEVQAAFTQARVGSQRVIVEKFIAGSALHLLLANHELVCVVAGSGSPLPATALHASIVEMALRVSRALEAGLLAITLVTPDPRCALTDVGGAIVDLDVAPQLDRLLAGHADLMAQAAEGFVRWLYPTGALCRIPLVAVTGTNGKTTTSRMIARIMRSAGFRPGMASTSGIYFNEVLHQAGDQAGSGGHHIVFESRTIDMGVLETARGAVAHSGFMFDWCDVGVCLNVTADHIGEYGIDTLQQMTVLKRSILARARRAVVLNADYTTCRDMLPFAAGIQVYLAAVEATVAMIRDGASQPSFACVLEEQAGTDWIIVYEPDGKRWPVMPASAIPATLDGLARFNISNAQHAICACHALGVGFAVMRKALSTFDASFENTPGRLNIYRELPFLVVMDYAHNPDGMEKLCACIDQMDVPGRRILLYAVSGNRSDQEVANAARSAVGHFDHFFCRSYPGLRGRQPGEIPALMNTALLHAGVPSEQITLVSEAEQGALQALSLARAGDVVVLCPGSTEVDKMWQQIISFRPGNTD